jgi:hypothetical protein
VRQKRGRERVFRAAGSFSRSFQELALAVVQPHLYMRVSLGKLARRFARRDYLFPSRIRRKYETHERYTDVIIRNSHELCVNAIMRIKFTGLVLQTGPY